MLLNNAGVIILSPLNVILLRLSTPVTEWIFLLDNLVSLNGNAISSLQIKKFMVNIRFESSQATYKFPTPFLNDCICALINDYGSYRFEIFTVGYVDKSGIMIECFKNPSYNNTDTIEIIAIGY